MNYSHHVHSIGVSDPHVLADRTTNKYYMTSSGFTFSGESTQRPGSIVTLVSEDLIHWSDPQVIFDCTGTDFWGSTGYPATEMHYINGKYYLSSTGRAPGYQGKSMILMADNPLGPFMWLSNEPYSPPGWQTLDTTLYMDKRGHPWIVYAHEWVQVSDGQFATQPLSDDLSRSVGNPMILFRASEAVWSDDQIWSKTDGGGVTDGCWLHRMGNGSLIMLWTSRSRTGYAMGYAKSSSGEIYGPWIQMERPLYGHDGGHCMLFRKLDDGRLIMSMHLADRGPKMLSFFEMEEKDGDIHIINEITGNWLVSIGGTALPYKKNVPSCEEPAFTKLGSSGYVAIKDAKIPVTKIQGFTERVVSEAGELLSSDDSERGKDRAYVEYPVHVHELNVQDPYILADPVSKKYYLYANRFKCGKTSVIRHGTGNTFYAMESVDLVTWSNPILVFEQNDFWANDDYSAPEVHYYKGKYCLIGSFSALGKMRRCQVLSAEKPLGPFLPIGSKALTPPAWQCMDGTLYVDRSGDPWLVFAHDWVQVYDGQICAIRLTDDLIEAVGDPVILFRGSEASWGDDFMYCNDEGGGAARAPWVHRMKDGGLIILWTNCTSYGYAVGVAKSLSGEIYGPWKQYDRPIYCHDGAHASLFTRFVDGMLMMPLYHLGRNGPGISTIIEEVEEYNGCIEIINEFTGNYWGSIGGHSIAYRGPGSSKDIPTYSVLENYGGMLAKRTDKWGMAPETKFNKGKITLRD